MSSRGRRHNEASARLRTEHRPCWLCGQPIDYTLTWPDPASFSLDHIKSRATHPLLEHEPTNHAAAHLSCNSSRQTNDPKPTIGATSRQW